MYDPWTDLDRLRGWRVDWVTLPPQLAGLCRYDTHTILLDRSLSRQAIRSTLAHEIIHAERGPAPESLREREEVLVEQLAARRLIDIVRLGDALAWSPWPDEVADELDVDRSTLMARVAGLRRLEVSYLEVRTVHQWEVA